MKKETIANENKTFFISSVGMILVLDFFIWTIVESREDTPQFSTDTIGYPGNIEINYSSIKEGGQSFWNIFIEKIQNGLLKKLSLKFKLSTNFEGDFSERVTLEEDGYIFSFHIKKYERDINHDFEIISPDDLGKIEENEKLGRIVSLTICPKN